jgi:hypothetical protein
VDTGELNKEFVCCWEGSGGGVVKESAVDEGGLDDGLGRPRLLLRKIW